MVSSKHMSEKDDNTTNSLTYEHKDWSFVEENIWQMSLR